MLATVSVAFLAARAPIILFVEGIPQVVDAATQEAFSDEPRGPNEFPLFFHLLPGMRRGGVCDGRVAGCWFLGDCVRRNVGEIVVFLDAEDVGE